MSTAAGGGIEAGDESREAALHRGIHEDEEVVAVRVVGGRY